MSQKTILVTLPESKIPMEAFKNALHIFRIKRIHLTDSEAYIQFRRSKDLQTFTFTNSGNKISSLGGATYQGLDKDFQWKFSPQETYNICNLPEDEKEETEADSEEGSPIEQNPVSLEQLNQRRLQEQQQYMLQKSRQSRENLRIALRKERIKQEEQRRKMMLQEAKQKGIVMQRNPNEYQTKNEEDGRQNERNSRTEVMDSKQKSISKEVQNIKEWTQSNKIPVLMAILLLLLSWQFLI